MSSGTPGNPTGPMEAVRRGMRVVDAAGEDVGTVEMVKLGDPQAATTQGQTVGDSGLVADVEAAFGGDEPRVPDELAAQLLRVGFVKVDGPGLLDRDAYVPAAQIEDVVQDVVHLAVARKDLLRKT